MKTLVLDNYDSFVYNLVHLTREMGYTPEVMRNNKIHLKEVERFDKILLSPGPGLPSEAGIMPELIRKYAPSKSILGICLGHQAIGEAFGAKLYNLATVMHGVATQNQVLDRNEALFKNLPHQFKIGRYHSWVIDKHSDLSQLVITATDEHQEIMGIRHQQYDVRGLQFHPESVLTEYGKLLIENWLKN